MSNFEALFKKHSLKDVLEFQKIISSIRKNPDKKKAIKFEIEYLKALYRVGRKCVGKEETNLKTFPFDGPAPLTVEPSIYHAVAKAAVELAQTIEAKVIIAYSTSGNTAVRIARERPLIPLFVSTVELNIQRRLSILYGATTSCQSETDYEAALLLTKQMLQKADIVRKNDAIVVVAGFPFGLSGSTNSIRVEHI